MKIIIKKQKHILLFVFYVLYKEILIKMIWRFNDDNSNLDLMTTKQTNK